jgi:transcriptional regulator with XRE-family HTH domain
VNFGETLSKLRERAGLTQASLAKKAGLSLRTIQGWEQGRRSPVSPDFFRLVRALGVDCTAFAADAEQDRRAGADAKARGGPRKPDASAGKPVAGENTELVNVTAGKAKVAKGKKGKGK